MNKTVTLIPVLALILTCSGNVAAEPGSGRVTASTLNMRRGPGTEHAVVGRLERGTRVTIKGERGGWIEVTARQGGRKLRGWVATRYVARDGDEEESGEASKPAAPSLPKRPFKGSLKSRKDRLRFIHDPSRSTLDLLGAEGLELRRFPWDARDYPGSPKGPNEGKARALARALIGLRPERRVNTGPHKLPFDWKAVEPRLVKVPGQERYRLHAKAAESFVRMRAAAAKDGITLKIVSAARTPSQQKRLAGGNRNPAAVAQGVSTHNYGLAIDFAVNPGAAEKLKEVTTRPFSNVMAMRRTPVHKWLFFFAHEFGWYPYTNEPWHWEFNPESLRKSFP